MTLLVFLEIVGMALVGALGGVGIFEVLRHFEKRKANPGSQSAVHDSSNKGKIAMPT